MAYKKNISESTNLENKDNINVDNKIQEENKNLKKQIEMMQAQMELLAKQIASNNSSQIKNNTPERNIEFINLIPGTLVLKGHQYWKIEGQFNSRPFMESEAKLIVNNMQNAIRSGCVYIADNEFVKENDLAEAYKNMLSDNQLKNLFNKNFNEIIEIYKTVPKRQQEIIITMIKEDKEKGKNIDANILIQIGKLCGQDLISDIKYEDEE